MFRKLFQALIVGGIVITLAACTPTTTPSTAGQKTEILENTPQVQAAPTLTAAPVSTNTAIPTAALQAQPITRENAAELQIAASASLTHPYDLKWSADSSKIGARDTNQDGMILFNAQTLSVESNVEVTSPFYMMDYSPENGLMAVTSNQQTLEIRSITDGTIVHAIQPPNIFVGSTFSPDGRTLAEASADNWAVTLWDMDSGQSIKTLTGFETAAPVYNVKYSRDGRFLIWYARASVQVQHIASEQFSPPLNHEDFVTCLEMSPDGNTLAASTAGTVDGQFLPYIRLWDVQSGQVIAELDTGQQSAYSVSFSPDGSLLAASTSAYVLIWDMKTQKQIASLVDPGGAVNGVAFSPDGLTLATAADDGSLRLWKVQQ